MSNRNLEGSEQFRKSVGASLESLMGTSRRSYFILEIKTPTEGYSVGQTFTYISDYIEMGRDPNVALHFSPNNQYISRKHAAIQKEGRNYILKHFSQTNPTLLNGRPVNTQYILKNGDEIQLSMEGPKIGFLAPANNAAKSLPLATRIDAFKREAFLPYKAIILIVLLVLLLILGGLIYLLS